MSLNDSPEQKCRDDQHVFQQFGAAGANHRLNEQIRQAHGEQGQSRDRGGRDSLSKSNLCCDCQQANAEG